MSNKLDYIKDLLKSCFLPELTQDLDSCPLQLEHFDEYRQMLDHELPNLFDYVQQNDLWIFSNDADTLQVRCDLLVLLCELTAPDTVYQSRNQYLLENAQRLLSLHLCRTLQFSDTVLQRILSYYQEHIRADCWKRNLGSTHGFLRFLEFSYDDNNYTKVPQLNPQWITFCLAAGLTMRECYEPTYKEMSTRIFIKILKHSKTEDIRKMNIDGVIYDAVFKNVCSMESVSDTNAIWNCLCICLDFLNDIDSLSWNPADDMIEALIRNITLAPNSTISICLLEFIPKICSRFSMNRKEIEEKVPFVEKNDILRQICADSTSYASFRWAKSILQLFVAESNKLMACPKICRHLLQEMHSCYMVCILPIPIEVVEKPLIIFLDKFATLLMEVIVVHKHDPIILKEIRQFIETFHWQLQRPNIREEISEDLSKFQEAFTRMLQNELFSNVY